MRAIRRVHVSVSVVYSYPSLSRPGWLEIEILVLYYTIKAKSKLQDSLPSVSHAHMIHNYLKICFVTDIKYRTKLLNLIAEM